MDLIPRDQWGARRPKSKVTGKLTGPSTGHWNGPGIPVVDHSKCAAQVRGVQNFHMDSRGWSDIAYNFIICPHGYTFEGRGLNIVNGANGTNTANRTSHAIMWLAGKGNEFNDAEKFEFRQCVKYVDDHTMAPDSAVGHRDHKSTECPGNERYNWIHAGMPIAGGGTPPPSQSKSAPSHGAAMFATCVHPVHGTIFEAYVGPSTDVNNPDAGPAMFRSAANIIEIPNAIPANLGGLLKNVNVYVTSTQHIIVSGQGIDDKIYYCHFQEDWTWSPWTPSTNVKLHPGWNSDK